MLSLRAERTGVGAEDRGDDGAGGGPGLDRGEDAARGEDDIGWGKLRGDTETVASKSASELVPRRGATLSPASTPRRRGERDSTPVVVPRRNDCGTLRGEDPPEGGARRSIGTLSRRCSGGVASSTCPVAGRIGGAAGRRVGSTKGAGGGGRACSSNFLVGSGRIRTRAEEQ